MNVPLTILGVWFSAVVFLPAITIGLRNDRRRWKENKRIREYNEQYRSKHGTSGIYNNWNEKINVIVADTVLPRTQPEQLTSIPIQGEVKKQQQKKPILSRSDKLPKWFIGTWGIGDPSPAEQRIIDELVKYNIHWEREVSFEGLLSTSGGYCRFDFYLPDHNIIIEYHGKPWHIEPERVANDTIKQEFCSNHNINLIVYNSKHYYHLEDCIMNLMDNIGILSKH